MTKKNELEETRAKFRETMERQRAAVSPTLLAPSVSPRGEMDPVLPVADEKPSPKTKVSERVGTPARIARPSIRLTDEDLARVREVIGHALSLSETLNTTEVLRLALHEWDFKKLTAKKIAEIRTQDGRRKTA